MKKIFTLIVTVTLMLAGTNLAKAGVHGDEDISVYPNPAISNITINIGDVAAEHMTYTIFNVLGQVVLQSTISTTEGGSEYIVEITDLPGAIYVIKVEVGGRSYLSKFTKRDK